MGMILFRYRILFFTYLLFNLNFGSPLPARTGRQRRIIGGVPALPGEFPWMVSLQRNDFFGPVHFCSGIIISQDLILTAAHCIKGMHAIAVWIVAGQTSLNHISSNDTTAQVIQAASLTSHPHFDRRSLRNDIGIIRLQKVLKFRVNVQKVKLPPKGFIVPSGSLTTIAGWGSVQDGGGISSDLMKAKVPTISDEACRSLYDEGAIEDSVICAGYPTGGFDSCTGDSGGQLLMPDETLVGIVSWGLGCGQPEYPGVYTEVSFYVDWIDHHIHHHHHSNKKK